MGDSFFRIFLRLHINYESSFHASSIRLNTPPGLEKIPLPARKSPEWTRVWMWIDWIVPKRNNLLMSFWRKSLYRMPMRR